jgi:hypothetical protein
MFSCWTVWLREFHRRIHACWGGRHDLNGPYRCLPKTSALYCAVAKLTRLLQIHVTTYPSSRMCTSPRIATVCALLLSFLGPSMVCALPFSQLTSSERDCCRNMQGECGGMKVPASHSCCQRTGPSHVDATQPESRAFHPVISLPAVLPQSALIQSPRIVFGRSTVPDHSPPITSAPAISILRI